ncbi:MAG: glycosyltransferase family 4 protein [Cyanobacteriota bacterium]|nr:glycosyltransferase family 4 protein [Cyanobacteriota bacterium]
MHIAWLGKKSPFCGNVTYSREITNALLERGYQVSFLHFAQETVPSHAFVPSRRWKTPPLDSGTSNCQDVPLPCLYKSTIYTIPTLKSSKVLANSLRQLKPDLVHASLTLSPLDFLLPEICEELGIPLVATFHPPFDGKRLTLTSGTQHLTYQVHAPCLARYDRTIVFSQIQRDLLVRLGVPRSRVAVIPNGVDAIKYSPGASSLKAELNADRIFVYQGRIAIEKNVEALLKAWKQSEMGSGSKLLIVGDGPLAPSLMASYGGEHGILWLGFIADEAERIEILRGADVFILPSFVEGLSLSLLEGMACGMACLATDVGADGEVVADGAGVILDPQHVTSQLQTLLPLFRDHPELTNLLGYKARQRVLERYTLDKNITALEGLYDRVLQQQHQVRVSIAFDS